MYLSGRVSGWICLIAITLKTAMEIDAANYMETDSDFGELFLVQNQTASAEWSVLYIEKGIYFRRDSSQKICVRYRQYYYQNECFIYEEFRPTNLTVHYNSQRSIPNGLFQFWAFKRLQNLEMTHINLADIHRPALLGADALKILNISHNALTKMPSMAFSEAWNLTGVDLSHNQIASMASDVFKVEFKSVRPKPNVVGTTSCLLKVIRLNHNHLTFIDSEWFSNLRHLSTLTLNDNFLTELAACSVFNTNIPLRTLQLQNNNFFAISTTGFFGGQCINQLEAFDISNNPNSTGTISVSANTINMSNTNSEQCIIPQNAVILLANHNRIYQVVVDARNTHLRRLHLSHNQIDSADFLMGLEQLEVIDLSYNQLTQMNENVLGNMVNLKRLDISHNTFATIDIAFVKPAKSLEYLDISNNFLSGRFVWNVEANALTMLNISNNNYTSLQHNLRKRMPRLTHIDLNNNFFNCEELTSLLLFMHFDNITAIIQADNELSETDNVKGIKCYQPKYDSIDKDSNETSLESTKTLLIKTIENKLGNLETKLVGLFKNMTETKSMVDPQ